MEIKTMYRCEMCGELHHGAMKAAACEKCHYIVKSITPLYEEGRPMPKAIDIEFINGNNCNVFKRFYLS